MIKPFVLSTRDKILSVAKRWREQHFDVIDGGKPSVLLKNNKSKLQVYNELLELDLSSATSEIIDTIIGNASWTRITCDMCKNNVDMVAVFDDGNDCCVYVCETCMCIALDELKKRNDKSIRTS